MVGTESNGPGSVDSFVFVFGKPLRVRSVGVAGATTVARGIVRKGDFRKLRGAGWGGRGRKQNVGADSRFVIDGNTSRTGTLEGVVEVVLRQYKLMLRPRRFRKARNIHYEGRRDGGCVA